MRGCKLDIGGYWGHFRRPETNNQPLTHDFITKTALLGMMGAILGKSRTEMREKFPQWSQALLYGVSVSRVHKESWSFTMRDFKNYVPCKDHKPAPGQLEILKNPRYTVFLGLADPAYRADFEQFVEFVQDSKAIYNPVLGIHNCPVNRLDLLAEGEFQELDGRFETRGFVPVVGYAKPELPAIQAGKTYYQWRYDKLATFQNSDWWNLPDKYIEVCYAINGSLQTIGKHYVLGEEAVCLI